MTSILAGLTNILDPLPSLHPLKFYVQADRFSFLWVKGQSNCKSRHANQGPMLGIRGKDQNWEVRKPWRQWSELLFWCGRKGYGHIGWNSKFLYMFSWTVEISLADGSWSCFLLQNRNLCSSIWSVWRKTACLKIRYPLCENYQREALSGLFSH